MNNTALEQTRNLFLTLIQKNLTPKTLNHTRRIEIPLLSSDIFYQLFRHKIAQQQQTPTLKKRKKREEEPEEEEHQSFLPHSKSTTKETLRFDSCSELQQVFGERWFISFFDEHITYVNCTHAPITISLIEERVSQFQTQLIKDDDGEVIPETITHLYYSKAVISFEVGNRTRWGPSGSTDPADWMLDVNKLTKSNSFHAKASHLILCS